MTSSQLDSPTPNSIVEDYLGSDAPGDGDMTQSDHDTIQFISEGSQPPVEYDYVGISKLLVDTAADDTHTIKSYLARAVQIGEFDLGTNVVSGNDVFFSNIFAGLFNNKTIADKLSNFFAMRCTFCTKIVVNSQPFQTGVYYFSQRPYHVQHTYQNMTSYWPAYDEKDGVPPNLLLMHKTGFPGTMLNLSVTSEETIKVPYVGVTPSISVSKAFGNAVALTNVIGLADATNAPHAYATVYAWLEDVELIGADPSPPKAQFILSPQAGKHLDKLIRGEAPTQAQEAEDGPVTKVAKTVGTIAKTLSRIPIVSDIAGPVSWACDAVGAVGSIFGFSKPNDPKHSETVTNDPFRSMVNCDMPSHATKLTVTKNAEIAQDSLGPTEYDEMNINEIASRPCVYNITKWTTEQKRGTELASWYVNPSTYAIEATRPHVTADNKAGTQTLTALSYIAWITSLFQYWRGGMKFGLTFAANQFHSGRLRFVCNLDSTHSVTADNFDDPSYYSVIYDLRAGDSFDVEVPFMSIKYWRLTDTSGKYSESNMAVHVFVETQLVAGPQAPQHVQFAMMPKMADDFAVAMPINTYHGNAEYHAVKSAPTTRKLIPQGMTTNADTQNHQANILMYPQPPEHARTVATTQSMGDPITSMRTLMKRYAWKASTDLPAQSTGILLPFQRFIDPYDASQTWVEQVRGIYRFCRGGMRFMLTGFQTETIPTKFKLVSTRDLTESFIDFTRGVGRVLTRLQFEMIPSVCEILVREDLRGCFEVEIPFYSPYAMLDNMPMDVPTEGLSLAEIPLTNATELALIWRQEYETTVDVYEAAADDFSCGYIIGPPIYSSLKENT